VHEKRRLVEAASLAPAAREESVASSGSLNTQATLQRMSDLGLDSDEDKTEA